MYEAFKFPAPFNNELKDMYGSEYEFSEEIKLEVERIFKSPSINRRHYKVFNAHMMEFDARDMLKPAYRVWLYYKSHPQQFGNEAANIADTIIQYMYKAFLSIHTSARKDIENKYYRVPVKQMHEAVTERLIPMLAKENPIKRKKPKRVKRLKMEETRVYKEVMDKVEDESWSGAGFGSLDSIRW